MANTKFDSKSFNPEAFKYIYDRIPRTRLDLLRQSRALVGNPDIRTVFNSQNGTAYARLAMRGLLDGDPLNYDGQTDITATSTKTYEQGIVVVGRAKAWTEKDFSYDITGGVDFMQNVAEQVADFWEDYDQDTILAILEGIFGMTGGASQQFVTAHTYTVEGNMEASTLNSAIAQACGDHKNKFRMVFMHSAVATNLENLNLVQHLKYTDANGVQRDLELYTWNGRNVLVDDDMPVADGQYTSYVLGDGAISFEDIGAKVPFEMERDPATNGGEDTLYTRQRKVFAPYGISYEKASQATLSPTLDELKTGANWILVHSGETAEADRSYIAHKAIPICRILSAG